MRSLNGLVETREAREFAALESLEPRRLLAAPYEFVGIGVRYDAGPALFFSHGSIGEDDAITGAMQLATLAGAGPEQAIDWVSYSRGTGAGIGGFMFGTRDGFTPYASQVGTRFISEEGRDIGTFVGRDGDGAVRDFAVFMQPAGDIPNLDVFQTALNNPIEVQMMRLTAGGDIETFTLTITPNLPNGNTPASELTFSYELASGTVTATRHVLSFEDGVATLDGGERLVFGNARDVLLTDFDNTDGIVGVAAGRLRARIAQIPGLYQNGVYHGSINVTGPVSAEFFGVDPMDLGPDGAVVDVVIRLQLTHPGSTTNQFQIYLRSEYEAGGRTPVNTGTWRTIQTPGDINQPSLYRVQLTAGDESFAFAYFSEGSGGAARSFHFDDVLTPLDAHETVFGVVSGSNPTIGNENQPVVIEYLASNENGRPTVYVHQRLLEGGSIIQSVDLIDQAGGEAVVGELITWVAGARHFWAGLSASGDVQVWQYFGEVGFIYTNLTDTLPGALPIAGNLAFTAYSTDDTLSAAWENQHLAGITEDGVFVVYDQINAAFVLPDQAWRFTAVTGQLLNSPLPNFTSDLVGWRSSWEGIHFAGINNEGEIVSVWTTPSLDRWLVSFIADETAAEDAPLIGNLAVVRTPWDTFHINGTDADGNLISTWWSGAFGWQVENLTDQFDGPSLAPGTLTANYGLGLGNMNIVGADENGQARVYWWGAGTGWDVNSLSASVDPSDIPLTPWRITATTWGTTFVPPAVYEHSQSLLGRNEDGHLVRLVWRTDAADAWLFEDVTEASVPLFM